MTWLVFLVAFLVPLAMVAVLLRRILAFARTAAEARRRAESAGTDAAAPPDLELPPVLQALLRRLAEAKAAQLAASHPELRQAIERSRATSPVAPLAVDTASSAQERWLRGALLLLVGLGLALLARAL